MSKWDLLLNFLDRYLPIDFWQLVATAVSVWVAWYGIIILPKKLRRKNDIDLLYRYLAALDHQAGFCWGVNSVLSKVDSIEKCAMGTTGDVFVWDGFYAVRALLLHYKKAKEVSAIVADVSSEYQFRHLVSALKMINATIANYQNFLSQDANSFIDGTYNVSGEKESNPKFKSYEEKFKALRNNALEASQKIEKEFNELIDALIAFMRDEFPECKNLRRRDKPPQ
ncbi:MAG: hypothetical protein MJE68_08010 [Proteobacteria bacterium]|nr:hypothetical protein [Pseudomonadota bacterium]